MPKSLPDNTKGGDPYHHGNLREALLQSGAMLLETKGLEGFSLREVARAAGVSPSAPYRHFADRHELVVALAAEGYREAANLLKGEIGSVALSLVRFGEGHPALWQVMMGQPASGGDALETARGNFLAELVGVVEREAGERDPELAIRKAVAIWAQVVGTVQLQSSGALALLDAALLPAVDVVADVLVSRRRLAAAAEPPRES